MKSLAWKLATVAAVIGIGFLVLLQAQRGMNQALLNKQAEAQGVALGAATTAPESASTAKNPADSGPPKAVAEVPSQQEPPATATTLAPEDPKADSASKPAKTTESTTASTTASADRTGPSPGGDPFGDFNDAKHASPTSDSQKTAANSTAPALTSPAELKPSGAVKQASASSPESTLKADAPKVPAANAASPPAALSPAAAPGSTPGAPDLLDSKAPIGQTEPPDSAPSNPSAADQKSASKDVAKDAAGPQLFPPAGGPELPSPGGGTPSKKADQAPKLELPTATADSRKQKPIVTAQASGNSEPAPFPALDDDAPAPRQRSPEKDGSKTPPASQTAAPPHPDPFPIDQAKEVPLVKPPEPKTPEPKTPETKQVAQPIKPAIESPPAGPKMANLAAPSDPPASAHPNGDVHTESGSDFQGDGTVGEQAPLGPQRPQLNIEKVAPPNALIGQPLIYSILVKNVGTSEAHDVVVEDRIPKGTKLSGTMPRAELTGKRLIWRIGNLGPNEQRKISIKVIPLEAGEIGSVATVNFVSEAAAETTVTAPRLEFELSAPKDAKLGANVPFHFKVKNVGTGEARGVVIRDLIPQGLSHGAGNDLEYEIGRLPAGKFRELTLELKASKIGPTTNRALVVGEGGLSVRAEAAIEVIGSKIGLTRNGPPRRYLGRPAVFASTIVNESKYDIEGVTAVETVPPGMEFVGATHGGQFNEGTRTIAWRIDRMTPNETRTLKSKLIPKATGEQTSTVRVSVPNGEAAEATTQTIVEGFAALGVDVAGADGPVDVGEKVTLRVNARNKGTIAATNVLVTVDIPDQMTVLSVRGPGTHTQSGNQVQFGPIPTLEGRTVAACELVLQAAKRGDSRIHVSLRADQVDKPLTREESVLVLSESSEPAASR